MKWIFSTIVAALIVLSSSTTFAHSGGTDASGCHRDSSTGTRHCHGGSSGSGAGGDVDMMYGLGTATSIIGALLLLPAWVELETPGSNIWGWLALLNFAASELSMVGGAASIGDWGNPWVIGVNVVNAVGAGAAFVSIIANHALAVPVNNSLRVSVTPQGVTVTGVF